MSNFKKILEELEQSSYVVKSSDGGLHFIFKAINDDKAIKKAEKVLKQIGRQLEPPFKLLKGKNEIKYWENNI